MKHDTKTQIKGTKLLLLLYIKHNRGEVILQQLSSLCRKSHKCFKYRQKTITRLPSAGNIIEVG